MNHIPIPIFFNMCFAQMFKFMKHTMENNTTCSLLFNLKTQSKIDVEQDLNKSTIINGDHVDVWVCKFKTLKGLLPKLIYNKDNRKQ